MESEGGSRAAIEAGLLELDASSLAETTAELESGLRGAHVQIKSLLSALESERSVRLGLEKAYHTARSDLERLRAQRSKLESKLEAEARQQQRDAAERKREASCSCWEAAVALPRCRPTSDAVVFARSRVYKGLARKQPSLEHRSGYC